jgi:hypothetical protein
VGSDAPYRLREGDDHVGIRRLVKADVAVTYLHKRETRCVIGEGPVDDPHRRRNPGSNAILHFASAGIMVVVVGCHLPLTRSLLTRGRSNEASNYSPKARYKEYSCQLTIARALKCGDFGSVVTPAGRLEGATTSCP